MRNKVEILAIGNELLIGQTLDTNSNWLAKHLHAAGWTVQRITTLRDSLTSIEDGVVQALRRKPDLLLTVGGLGPTYDDMTLRGLSIAIRKPLTLDRDALAMVTRKYQAMAKPTALTVHRSKMAMLPKGAKPLPNPIGTAPGVIARAGYTTVIAFPGVPSELKAIFKDSVIPILRKSSAKAPSEMYLMIVGIIESALAPTIEEVRNRFPTLYLKSHPLGRETGVRSLIKLHVYTTGKDVESTVKNALAFTLKRLSENSRG